MIREFKVEFNGTCILELDDAVIDIVDDGWRETFYSLHTPEEIAEHIAFNFIENGASSITQLDGWADQPYNAAQIKNVEYNFDVEEL